MKYHASERMMALNFNPTKTKTEIASLWWLPLLHGIALLFLGFSLLFRHELTLDTLSRTFGIYFFSTGVVNLSTAMMQNGRRNRLWLTVSGGINSINGLMVLCASLREFPINKPVLLLILAGLASVNGMLFLMVGRSVESLLVEGWAWSGFVLGVLCLGFGILFLAHRLIPVAHVMLVNAIWALLGGIGMVCLAFRIRKEEQI